MLQHSAKTKSSLINHGDKTLTNLSEVIIRLKNKIISEHE